MGSDTIDNIIDNLFYVLPLIRSKLLKIDLSGIKKDITRFHYVIMRILHEEGALPISAIGKRILVPKAQMTSLVDRLIKLGLAERVPDSTDRRVINIVLTDQGNNTFEECRNAIKKSMRDMLARLSNEDLQNMSLALGALKDIGVKLE